MQRKHNQVAQEKNLSIQSASKLHRKKSCLILYANHYLLPFLS